MSSHSVSSILKMIQDKDIRFIDLRFTDMQGQQHHFTIPSSQINQDFFKYGRLFDGSSFKGWKNIENSDMILMPDLDSVTLDPFLKDPTLLLFCDVLEPESLTDYYRDPRSLAERAQKFLQESGIADVAYFGPENEFFIFDHVQYSYDKGRVGYAVNSAEAAWNSNLTGDNLAHRAGSQGGYSPLPPIDKLHDVRSDICKNLEKLGVKVEVHHHEVASAGQCEVGVAYNTLKKKADEVQKLKYAVHNTAEQHHKTATFMPKPYHGENGSGMHVHISLAKDGENIFIGEEYGGLSQTALYFIGGLIKHAHALNAFTNPSTNSYKRLMPNFEAPVLLAYSAKNRSAAIRIPFIPNPKARRIEARFPDSTANPYLAFSAILMAGIDGIQNKIDPGKAVDKNLYHLTDKDGENVPHMCASLDEALDALDQNREFLRKGSVFTDDMISAYIALKRDEAMQIKQIPHPLEFELYYSL